MMQELKHVLYSAVVILFLLIAVSCKTELPKISWTGENLEFGTTEKELPCGKSLEELDNATEKLLTLLQTELPENEKIKYYWLPKDYDLSPCRSNSSGCSDGSTVYTKRLFHIHELVHAILSVYGRKHPIFEEGLSVSFGGQPFSFYQSAEATTRILKDNLVENVKLEEIDYFIAGGFARYIEAAYGIESLMALYQNAEPSTTYKEFEMIFQTTLAVDLDELIDEFSNSYLSCYEKRPDFLDNLLPWSGEFTTVEMDCENREILGPLGEYSNSASPWLEYRAKLEINEERLEDIAIEKSPGWEALIIIEIEGGCGESKTERINAQTSSYIMANVAFEPGTYIITIRNQNDKYFEVSKNEKPDERWISLEFVQ